VKTSIRRATGSVSASSPDIITTPSPQIRGLQPPQSVQSRKGGGRTALTIQA
jgi:hypothetical protein